MDKKIKHAADDLYFDTKRKRLFTIGPQSVRVYDTKTMERIAVLRHPNPNQVYVDQTNGIVAIKSTEVEFAFYSADDYTPLGSFAFKGKRNWNSDPRFCYDEKEVMLYGVAFYAKEDYGKYVYCVSPKTLTYRLIPLTPEKKEGELLSGEKYIFEYTDYDFAYDPETEDLSITPIPRKEERVGEEDPMTWYELQRYENGSFYMIRNFYNVGGVGDRVYEALYGKFEEENGTLVLKEKLYSTKERLLERLDLELSEEELALARPLIEPSKVRENGGFRRSYRNEKGELFLITSKHLFHLVNGKFEKEYSSEYFSDYKEFEGRRYFGDWEFLHVQDIPKE